MEQVTAATALTRAQQIATGRMAPVLAEYDLTFAQLEVLIAVADRDHLVGMGELGAALGLTRRRRRGPSPGWSAPVTSSGWTTPRTAG